MITEARKAEITEALGFLEPESVQFLWDVHRPKREGVGVELTDGRRHAMEFGSDCPVAEIAGQFRAWADA